MALIKYGNKLSEEIVQDDLKRLSNQIYKLLPLREENEDWQKPLETILIHLTGMSMLFEHCQDIFFPLLCKLQGLASLIKPQDFQAYRRTIFECLGLLQNIKNNVC